MPKLGPYSDCATLAKLDGRTKEARLLKSLRAELVQHVGGSPSSTQRLLIDQAVQLQLRLALMDADGSQSGEMSERNSRQYLAALFALPMDDTTLALYQAHTGRQIAPTTPFKEAALIIGRRGGKSRV